MMTAVIKRRRNIDKDKLFEQRFSKDNVLTRGTLDGERPAMRHVDAYYEDGVFYVITHAMTAKMKQIAGTPRVTVCADLFSARGKGYSLGYVLAPENLALTEKLQGIFSSWIDNGDTDFSDENTVILKIVLEDAALFHGEQRYVIKF